MLAYLAEFNAIVCLVCQFAVPFGEVDAHLGQEHQLGDEERATHRDKLPAEARAATGPDSLLRMAAKVSPIAELAPPRNGHRCCYCDYSCLLSIEMMEHWDSAHTGPWEMDDSVPAKVQTFYKKKWFVVDDDQQRPGGGPVRSHARVDTRLDEWAARAGWTHLFQKEPLQELALAIHGAQDIPERRVYQGLDGACSRILEGGYRRAAPGGERYTVVERREFNAVWALFAKFLCAVVVYKRLPNHDRVFELSEEQRDRVTGVVEKVAAGAPTQELDANVLQLLSRMVFYANDSTPVDAFVAFAGLSAESGTWYTPYAMRCTAAALDYGMRILHPEAYAPALANVHRLDRLARQLIDSQAPDAAVWWDSRVSVLVGRHRFTCQEVQQLGRGVLGLAQSELCRQVLLMEEVRDVDAAEGALNGMLPLDSMVQLKDDLDDATPGYWFALDRANWSVVQPLQQLLIKRLGEPAIEHFRERVIKFLRVLAVAVHLICGVPPQELDSALLRLRFINGDGTKRQVFVKDGRVVVASLVLPLRLSRVVLIYLLTAKPLLRWLDQNTPRGVSSPETGNCWMPDNPDQDLEEDQEHESHDFLFGAIRAPILSHYPFHVTFQEITERVGGRPIKYQDWFHLVRGVGRAKAGPVEGQAFCGQWQRFLGVQGDVPIVISSDEEFISQAHEAAIQMVYGRPTVRCRVLMVMGRGELSLLQLGTRLEDTHVTVLVVPMQSHVASAVAQLEEEHVPHAVFGEGSVTGARLVIMRSDSAGGGFVARLAEQGRLRRIIYGWCHEYSLSLGQLGRLDCQHICIAGILPPSLVPGLARTLNFPEGSLVVYRDATVPRSVSFSVEQSASVCEAVARVSQLVKGHAQAIVYCRTLELEDRLAAALGPQLGQGVSVTTTDRPNVASCNVGLVVHVGRPKSAKCFALETAGCVAVSVIIGIEVLERGEAVDQTIKELTRPIGTAECRRRVLTRFVDGGAMAVGCEGAAECDVCACSSAVRAFLADEAANPLLLPEPAAPQPPLPTPRTTPTATRTRRAVPRAPVWDDREKARMELLTKMRGLCVVCCMARAQSGDTLERVSRHIRPRCPRQNDWRAAERNIQRIGNLVESANGLCYRCHMALSVCQKEAAEREGGWYDHKQNRRCNRGAGKLADQLVGVALLYPVECEAIATRAGVEGTGPWTGDTLAAALANTGRVSHAPRKKPPKIAEFTLCVLEWFSERGVFDDLEQS